MGWKQCVLPFNADLTPVHERLYALVLAKAADTGDVERRIAIFIRDEDFERIILLLSPDAAEFSDMLPGEWTDADPGGHRYGWTVLYSNGAVPADFGLRAPHIGE